MKAEALGGGFTDAPLQAAVAFRAALEALSRPGAAVRVTGAVPPAPLSVAAGVLVLTLLDGTTPVYLAGAHDVAAVRDWISFHTGAPFVAAGQAVFVIGTWDALMPVDQFAIGTADYPDRAATLFIEGPGRQAATLTGPGIQHAAKASLPDIAAFTANHARYPLGWDAFLTEGDQVIGLPRSTKVGAV
jgi:alpha-D-ribose 1-methylphosphonate 5-triphosphate synthase subunit PhnH